MGYRMKKYMFYDDSDNLYFGKIIEKQEMGQFKIDGFIYEDGKIVKKFFLLL